MKLLLTFLAAWLIAATPCAAQLTLTGVGLGGPAGGAPPANPGVVMAGEQPSSSTAAVTTAANTLKNVPIGTLVVIFINDGFQTPSSVTDSAGNTYPDLGTQNTSPASQKTGLYGAFITHAIVSGVTTFTVNSPSATSPFMAIYDVPSAIAADLTGPHAGNDNSSSTAWSLTIPTLNFSQEILLAGLFSIGEIPVTPPSGWTSVGSFQSGGFGIQFFWKNVSVTTSDTSLAGTFSVNQSWADQYATYTR